MEDFAYLNRGKAVIRAWVRLRLVEEFDRLTLASIMLLLTVGKLCAYRGLFIWKDHYTTGSPWIYLDPAVLIYYAVGYDAG